MNALKVTLAAGFALLASSSFAQSGMNADVTPEDIEGTWVSDGDYATFEASLCGDDNQLCGTLTNLSEEAIAPLLRAVVGQQIISNAEMTGEGEWQAIAMIGEVEATATITLTGPERFEVEGCLMNECQSIAFNKASDAD